MAICRKERNRRLFMRRAFVTELKPEKSYPKIILVLGLLALCAALLLKTG